MCIEVKNRASAPASGGPVKRDQPDEERHGGEAQLLEGQCRGLRARGVVERGHMPEPDHDEIEEARGDREDQRHRQTARDASSQGAMPNASSGTPMPTTVMCSVMWAAKLPGTRPGSGPAQAKSRTAAPAMARSRGAHRQVDR